MQPVVHAIGDQIAIATAQTLQQQGERAQVGHGIGHHDLLGHGPASIGGGEPNAGDRHHRLHVLVPLTAHHAPAPRRGLGRQAEPAEQRGHHIVGMAFDVDG